MNRYNILIILFFILFTGVGLYGMVPVFPSPLTVKVCKQDTLKQNQILYNGKIWRNLYYLVKKDQFLFSKEFLPGSLTINGKTFTDIYLKYDIFKDEILTPVDSGGILQLNKEMVDSFSVLFQNKTYRFIKMKVDGLKGSIGYFNILYKGKSSLFIEYIKKIEKLAVEGQYDEFYLLTRIYFMKDNKVHLIASKSDLLNLLGEDKYLIKSFIKKNKFRVSEKLPESFIPVIIYYDRLGQ